MANTFTKSGLTSEDHHLRMPDGHYQKTPPFDAKTDGKWSEWSGRKWIPAESVHLRPSYHGFGHTPSGSVHNIYSASDDVRRRAVSPSKQRGPSRSPPKV